MKRVGSTLRSYLIIDIYNLKYWQIIIAITVLGLITYGKNAFTLTVFGDEWAVVNMIVFDGTVNCLRSDANIFLRPLAICWDSLLYHIFGLNIIAFHVATLMLMLLRAIIFFLVLDRLFPKWRLFSLACALLFLVYPTGFHHLLFESGYQIVSHIFFFLASLLLIIFYQSYKWWIYLLALTFLVLSLLLYEAHMGLIILITFILFVISRGQSIYRRVSYLVPIVMVILFGAGRWLAQLQVGSMFGHSVDAVALSPKILLSRLIGGYLISLSAGLVNALNDLFYRHKYSHVSPTLVWGAVITVAFIIFAFYLIYKFETVEVNDGSIPIPFSWTELFVILAGGLIVIGAGYIPMITVTRPSLTFIPSRVNVIPGIGAVLVLTAIFSMLPKLLGWKGRKAVFSFVAVALPLIILSSATQRASQIESEIAWNKHTGIWQQMFTIAPDIVPNTYVLLVMRDVGRPMRTWAFNNALSVLYGHNDIEGQVFLGDYDSLTFTREGILGEANNLMPYDRTLLFVYDEENDKLEYVQKLPQDINLHPADFSQCSNCILDQPAQHTERRLLVNE